MPDEVGGNPFADGDDHGDDDHGGADDEFAPVVFDEAFVRAATVHEPTAQERLLAAAQARAEADAARLRLGAPDEDGGDAPRDPRPLDDGIGLPRHRPGRQARPWASSGPGRSSPPRGRYRRRGAHGVHSPWQRTVAWVLAVVMGIGVVALTFAAVYRGASGGGRQPAPPPASGQVNSPYPSVRLTSSTTP